MIHIAIYQNRTWKSGRFLFANTRILTGGGWVCAQVMKYTDKLDDYDLLDL